MEESNRPQNFEAVKARLDEIVSAVSNDELPLDDALELYEEAVALGLSVSDLLEEGIDPADADAQMADDPNEASAAAQAATAAPDTSDASTD